MEAAWRRRFNLHADCHCKRRRHPDFLLRRYDLLGESRKGLQLMQLRTILLFAALMLGQGPRTVFFSQNVTTGGGGGGIAIVNHGSNWTGSGSTTASVTAGNHLVVFLEANDTTTS